ncbi:fibronectin type III domain-containing protein [Leptospira perdikensis]|uniref:Fibronectin type-III domain-containing protein n=1 Tax=Leptospira perdikensis TaxID=2484948 RepID=A0A4R9JEQ1_9LEPT|nr:fibronectin type III domain-containing protein [Leptospira perdikensis]TGL37414.1 hypothetical protein EHQ49_14355 [Leptospira perdikensis]
MKKGLILLLAWFQLNQCILGVVFDTKENAFEKQQLATFLGAAFSSGVPVGGGTAGSQGARIQSQDELFTILIPQGAMEESVDFQITRYNANQTPFQSGYIPTSYIYEVTPSYVFKKDITVTITLDANKTQSMNLRLLKSKGFHLTSAGSSDGGSVLAGWSGTNSSLDGERVVIQTKSFSSFGVGTPPNGNLPPVIYGAYYYLKPNTKSVPYQLRAEVVEPDNDAMTVNLLVGPAGGSLNYYPMVREGSTNWYQVNIPYEAMVQAGIQIQVVATDSYGQKTTRPTSSMFLFPTDSGNPSYISNYDPDKDGDGFNDVWELDNGYNPNNPNNPTMGTPYPPGTVATIDSLEVFPNQVYMQVNETIQFAARGTLGGVQKFVNTPFHVTGVGLGVNPVGNLSQFSFIATAPGIAGVFATYQNLQTAATVHIADTLAPANITDLEPTALSSSRIRLSWTAPGSDGSVGRAAAYEVRRSNTAILNNTQCDLATGISHQLIPKDAGTKEYFDIDGHQPQTTYHFCVRALDSAGNRNHWNAQAFATTYSVSDLVPPSEIVSATANVLSYQQVRLDWTSVGDNGNLGMASAYEIRRRSSLPIQTDDDCTAAVLVPSNISPVVSGSAMSFTVNGLSSGTIHYFCIRAFDSAGNRSQWSGVLQATTPFANQSPILSLTSSLSVTLGNVVNLDASSSIDPDSSFCGANLTNFQYNWKFLSVPPLSILQNSNITNKDKKSAQFTPDVLGDYVLEFSFKDDPGVCAAGPKTTVGNLIVTIRIDPPFLNLVSGGQTSAYMDWNRVIGASGYKVYYQTSPGVSKTSPSQSVSGELYALLSGLSQNATYYFRLVTIGSGGESALSTSEYKFKTNDVAPGLATGQHTNISAAQGDYSGGLGTFVYDPINEKIIIANFSGLPNSAKPNLYICNVDGTGCIYRDISLGVGRNMQGHRPRILLDSLNQKIIVLSPFAPNYSDKLGYFQCDLSGLNCVFRDISAATGRGNRSAVDASAVIDYANQKLLIVTLDDSTSQGKTSLFRCNLDGLNCTQSDISSGLGNNSGYEPEITLDPYNNKILVVVRLDNMQDSANRYKIRLIRCEVDGSGCQTSDISAGSSIVNSYRQIQIDRINKKLLMTGPEITAGSMTLFRSDLDGSNPESLNISGGVSGGGYYSTLTLDYPNQKLLAVGRGPNMRPYLTRCNLNATGCVATDISLTYGNNSGDYPYAIIEPTNGRLLVTTLNRATNQTLSLFRF